MTMNEWPDGVTGLFARSTALAGVERRLIRSWDKSKQGRVTLKCSCE
jgi:hypothetical protein